MSLKIIEFHSLEIIENQSDSTIDWIPMCIKIFDKSNLTELKDLEFQVKNEFKVTLDDEEQGENLELVPQ